MPEFLVITNRQNVLEVVDRLRSEDGVEIRVETDFSKGLKAIFYRLPDLVFIQEEIAGITAEKVAAQVRTLLDDEPIRLMLLHERMGEWDSGDPSFDGLIDTGLSFNDLVDRFREVLSVRPVKYDASQANAVGEDSALGLTVQTKPQDNGFEFDPFSDIFPAQIHHNWGSFSLDTGQDMHMNQDLPRPSEEPTIVDNEFCFETPGDIVSSIPLEKPEVPDLDKDLQKTYTKVSDTLTSSPIDLDIQYVEETRHAEMESPNQLISSIDEEYSGVTDQLQMESEITPVPISEKLRLKGVATQTSILKSGPVEPTVTAYTHPRTDVMTGADGEATVKKVLKGPSARPLQKDVSVKTPVFYPERNHLVRILKPGFFLLVIGIVTVLLVQNWEYLTQLVGVKEELQRKPSTPLSSGEQVLPSFIPRVPPDKDYASNHPGWERYPGGGIDYLVYRENGRLLAIQIVALPEGKISESFVKMCIRESTGLMNGDNWTTQRDGDFIVENSSLRNRGEIAVYRKFPEREIRGIVLTFK